MISMAQAGAIGFVSFWSLSRKITNSCYIFSLVWSSRPTLSSNGFQCVLAAAEQCSLGLKLAVLKIVSEALLNG